MKAIKASETGSDAPAAPPAFLDSLKAIDVSSLDRLIAIRQENERIAQYRAKAEEKRKNVAEAGDARGTQGYAKRAAALEQRRAPRRPQARARYRKLKALIDSTSLRQEQAQLQKDELQFRHEVGELGDDELKEKIAEPQQILDSCASDRRELDTSKARFVEALGSEEALEVREPVAAPAPVPAIAPSPVAAPAAAAALEMDSTLVPESRPARVRAAPRAAGASNPIAGAAALAIDVDDASATRVAQPIPDPVTRPAPAAPPPPPPAAPLADPPDGATVLLSTAAIVIENG